MTRGAAQRARLRCSVTIDQHADGCVKTTATRQFRRRAAGGWRQRVRRGVIWSVLGLFLAGGIAGVIGWHLSWSAPTWYKPPLESDSEANSLARAVEYRVMERASKVHPTPVSDPWAVRIQEHQLNAWLAVGLPDWFAREQQLHWPHQLGSLQVHLEPGQLALAIAVLSDSQPQGHLVPPSEAQPIDNRESALERKETGSGEQGSGNRHEDDDARPQTPVRTAGSTELPPVASSQFPAASKRGRVFIAIIEPRLEDGKLYLPVTGVQIGRLPLPINPTTALETLIDDFIDAGGLDRRPAATLLSVLAGRAPLTPEFILSDGRRVHLLDFQIEAGTLTVLCQTLPSRDAQDQTITTSNALPTRGQSDDEDRAAASRDQLP